MPRATASETTRYALETLSPSCDPASLGALVGRSTWKVRHSPGSTVGLFCSMARWAASECRYAGGKFSTYIHADLLRSGG